MGNKIDDLICAIRSGELVHRKDPGEKARKVVVCLLAIVGSVAAMAAIAYAVYRYMNPDYLEDFDDDFDDYEDEDDTEETVEEDTSAGTSE